jgi:hypothetical protein
VIATNLQRCGLHTRAMVWQADVRHALPIDARSACKTACVQWPQRLVFLALSLPRPPGKARLREHNHTSRREYANLCLLLSCV